MYDNNDSNNREDSNEEKLDILIAHAVMTNARLDNIDENLEEHMRRSEALEQRQEFIETEIKPLLEHINGFKWALGALAVITTVIKFLDILHIGR